MLSRQDRSSSVTDSSPVTHYGLGTHITPTNHEAVMPFLKVRWLYLKIEHSAYGLNNISGCVRELHHLWRLHNHDQNLHTFILPADISHFKLHPRHENSWRSLCGMVDNWNGNSDFRVQARRTLLELFSSRKLRQPSPFLYCCCGSKYPDRRHNALHAPSNDLASADVPCSEDCCFHYIHDWCIVSTPLC